MIRTAIQRRRAGLAMRLVRLAQHIHPQPLAVTETWKTVTIIPGGYQINVPGTDQPLAHITSGQFTDQRGDSHR